MNNSLRYNFLMRPYPKISDWLKDYPFHPISLIFYPVLALWAANYSEITAVDVHRVLMIDFWIAVGMVFCFRVWKSQSRQLGLIFSLAAGLFFSYGHVIYWIANKTHANEQVFLSPLAVTLLYPMTFLIGIWVALRQAKGAQFLTFFLNISTLALVCMVGAQIIWMEIGFHRPSLTTYLEVTTRARQQPSTGAPADLPDIYYVILDGYGREDALATFVDFDNTSFTRQLQERGFYVAAGSTSNYANTAPSLASSLNFQYINQLGEIMGSRSADYRPLRELIQKNQAMAVLMKYGYTNVTFETGLSLTEIKDSDQYINVQAGPNSFESLLLTNSLALLWTHDAFAFQYRNRIPAVLKEAGNLSGIPSPKFVFVHVMAAHPPFVFGRNGEAISSATRVEVDQAGLSDRTREAAAYRNQVSYVNTLVIQMIDQILAQSAKQPVIVLQGDHGSGIFMNWRSAEETCFDERKAILNAYYFPGGRTDLLYNTITPVNSLRVIFNTYLGTNFPLLEDRNYFSLNEVPYHFIEVTHLEGKCP